MLKPSLIRLEEKLTNLESENHVLSQQAVSMALNKLLSGCSRSILQTGNESGHFGVDVKPTVGIDQDLHSPSLNQRESSEGTDQSLCIIYKCLLQWRSLERTNVFDRNIQTIGHAIERTLKEWCCWNDPSTTSFIISHSVWKMTQGVNLSMINGGMSGGVDTLRQVEAKYPPALLSGSSALHMPPRTSRASLVKGSSRSVSNTEAQRAVIAHCQGIVNSLGNFLNILKANHVPPFLVRKVFIHRCCLSSTFYYSTELATKEWI
ncbi:hypothetical protein PanWU01x14_041670 [Parasponia andersonii]|uniref:Uncharacterized protein n=1 Tax=Parasponia andersonii TaxID=3476 RepID=A0A2P5DQH0_PARAD|nr:hypothetical protein PanWU01x14_041670 [Parasponia andersonii]